MSGSFEYVWWNACVHRLDLGLCSHPKEFWGNGTRNHVNSKGKIPTTGGSEEGWTHDAASHRTASPTHYPLSYSAPPHIPPIVNIIPTLSGEKARCQCKERWMEVEEGGGEKRWWGEGDSMGQLSSEERWWGGEETGWDSSQVRRGGGGKERGWDSSPFKWEEVVGGRRQDGTALHSSEKRWWGKETGWDSSQVRRGGGGRREDGTALHSSIVCGSSETSLPDSGMEWSYEASDQQHKWTKLLFFLSDMKALCFFSTQFKCIKVVITTTDLEIHVALPLHVGNQHSIIQ